MSNMARNYRQYSYSENDIKVNKDLYHSLPLSDIKTNDNNDNKKKKLINYSFKRFLMFIIHLSLIGLFEIVFFFNFIVSYLEDSLKNLTSSFVQPINNVCINYNTNQKIIFTDILNLFVNVSNIDNESNESYQQRLIHNRAVLVRAWLYFVGLITTSILLIALNYLIKFNVNIKKVLIDNLIMILLLGCYEYLFLKSIIFNYMVINNVELVKYMINQLNNCLTY